MTNPYTEMSRPELEDHLVEVESQWLDHCDRQAKLAKEGDTIQLHRKQILEAMGVSVLPVQAS